MSYRPESEEEAAADMATAKSYGDKIHDLMVEHNFDPPEIGENPATAFEKIYEFMKFLADFYDLS